MGTETTKTRAATTGAATIRANGQAAQACALGADGKCAFCGRVGLSVLPLRYAVTPSFLPGRVTDPTTWSKLGVGLKGKPPEGLKGHHYVLRTLRKGFVMVYFGSGLWHTYAVTASGMLRKMADPDDPDFKTDRELTPACRREGHNVPASFITIPLVPLGATRALPTKFWIAFSEVPWTRRVRQKYEGAGAAGTRTQRMQEFSTDPLGKQADTLADAFQFHPDEVSTTQRLNRLVLEYAEDDAEARSRTQYDASDPFNPKKPNHLDWVSAHGVSMRTGGAPAVAKFTVKPSDFNGQKFMASAIVLNDPLGMVQELNATRLQAMDSRQRYLSDVRVVRPMLISQSILGLKQVIGDQVAASVQQEETSKGLPDVQTETHTYSDGLAYSETTSVTTTRKERVNDKVTSLWSSLQEHYRETERAAFDTRLNATLKLFQDWIVRGDADYAYWLAQSEWVRRRHDFDNESPAQQDVLIEAFAAALSGGPSASPSQVQGQPSPQDTRVYEVWKDFIAKKPTDETNPIYVAIFGDQEELLEYLLPEGPNPMEDSLHKGSKLFKAVKNIIGTKELTSNTLQNFRNEPFSLTREAADKVPNPVRAAGAAAMDRIRGGWIPKATGAVANSLYTVGSVLSRLAANGASEIAKATVLRAIQGAVLLYERREIFIITTRIKMREYLAYLNDLAFRSSDAAIDAAAKGMRRMAQAGKNTVRSMAIAGVLHISDKKVGDAFVDVVTWAYDKLEDVTKEIDALPSAQDAARSAHQTAQAATAAESAAMATAMRVHPLTISPGAQKFVDAVLQRAGAANARTASLLKILTRGSLRTAGTGSGILAAASAVIQGWSFWDNLKKADKKFLGNNEARILVVAAGTAAIGAVMELVGVGVKLMSEKTWGTAIGRIGGALGAAASIVEGVQAGMASIRTARRGDRDASVLYALSGVAMVAGGAVGIYGALTGAALLGPIGWALILIAAGVLLLYFAMKAEDSQAAIWLDRCYWGKGARYANAKNSADRPWTDAEIDDELSQLNAIILGLAGETGFNDDGWGFTDFVWDTVKAKITFPNYDAADSAFEWRLCAVKGSKAKSVTLASGKHNTLPVEPNAGILAGRATPVQSDGTKYFRNLVGPTYKLEGKNKDVLVAEVSVEVAVKYFGDVELTADYVPDLSDPHGRASLELNKSDW
ncbi:hypothetical protein NU688_28690 [Variovorax sp. ZS18.2.2]|uniref:T6SS effector BTH_I2691 family protein n=1 Tax=Variovorax sp. ZS18.2.2 TaxID=2971255 RepID=UPI002150E678|nr:T6SS effector BTH_I2691 family protein [Variovorax sp. ZS18.2.2]MCR6480166.1 hypothetical protein [Variovorax sp. ZS18.2.2]